IWCGQQSLRRVGLNSESLRACRARSQLSFRCIPLATSRVSGQVSAHQHEALYVAGVVAMIRWQWGEPMITVAERRCVLGFVLVVLAALLWRLALIGGLIGLARIVWR